MNHSKGSGRARFGLYTEAEPEFQPRVVAEFSAKSLHANYDAIRDQLPGKSVIPMIKANAYGHGAEWAAKQLFGFPALYGLGVATLEEGREIREALGPRGRKTKIIVFSGTAPWSDEKGEYCEQFGLTATIAGDQDWQHFLRGGWAARIPYQLKFNTGMNRLGISPALARNIAKAVMKLPAEQHPQMVLSHLAMGERPDSSMSRAQAERFKAVRTEFASIPGVHFSLGNSAGIWNHKLWRLDDLTDVIRPGLSLYGVTPWPEAPVRGLLPVMTLKASVIAINRLKVGDRIGYGGTYRVTEEPFFAATLSAGYADGLHRVMGNVGHAWLNGKPTRFVGRVSMDLSAVRGDARTRAGDWVEIIGPNVDIWAQAQAAGTIPYELLTSVSGRVQRKYE